MHANTENRRQYQRYALEHELIGHELALFGASDEPQQFIPGSVEDISEGGLCVLTSKPLTLSHPIQCKIPLAKIPVAVPVIMRVQWSHKASTGLRYRNGLQFLY